MTPYFETPLGKLYHGDCLEILPHLEPVDLVLTDPPYVGLSGGIKFYGYGVAQIKNISMSVGNPWEMGLEWIPLIIPIAQKGIIIFCSYHFLDEIPNVVKAKKVCLFTWYKRNSPLPVNNVPRFTTEYAWCFRVSPGLIWSKIETMRDIPLLPGGCMGKERIKNQDGSTAHPTQKPIELMLYLLNIGGDSVLDPFTGSGSTAVACERLNRKWIGIEISEKYCEIAAKRIENERKQRRLF